MRSNSNRGSLNGSRKWKVMINPTGDEAWEYVKEQTGIDLKAILVKLAGENTRRS